MSAVAWVEVAGMFVYGSLLSTISVDKEFFCRVLDKKNGESGHGIRNSEQDLSHGLGN